MPCWKIDRRTTIPWIFTALLLASSTQASEILSFHYPEAFAPRRNTETEFLGISFNYMSTLRMNTGDQFFDQRVAQSIFLTPDTLRWNDVTPLMQDGVNEILTIRFWNVNLTTWSSNSGMSELESTLFGGQISGPAVRTVEIRWVPFPSGADRAGSAEVVFHDTIVPEPSTATLMACGLVSLGFGRRLILRCRS